MNRDLHHHSVMKLLWLTLLAVGVAPALAISVGRLQHSPARALPLPAPAPPLARPAPAPASGPTASAHPSIEEDDPFYDDDYWDLEELPSGGGARGGGSEGEGEDEGEDEGEGEVEGEGDRALLEALRRRYVNDPRLSPAAAAAVAAGHAPSLLDLDAPIADHELQHGDAKRCRVRRQHPLAKASTENELEGPLPLAPALAPAPAPATLPTPASTAPARNVALVAGEVPAQADADAATTAPAQITLPPSATTPALANAPAASHSDVPTDTPLASSPDVFPTLDPRPIAAPAHEHPLGRPPQSPDSVILAFDPPAGAGGEESAKAKRQSLGAAGLGVGGGGGAEGGGGAGNGGGAEGGGAEGGGARADAETAQRRPPELTQEHVDAIFALLANFLHSRSQVPAVTYPPTPSATRSPSPAPADAAHVPAPVASPPNVQHPDDPVAYFIAPRIIYNDNASDSSRALRQVEGGDRPAAGSPIAPLASKLFDLEQLAGGSRRPASSRPPAVEVAPPRIVAREDSELERALRRQKTIDKLIQAVKIAGHVEAYVSNRARTAIKTLAHVYDIDFDDRQQRKRNHSFMR